MPSSTRISPRDRKSTRLNSSHPSNSYAVFCLKKKTEAFRHILERKLNTRRSLRDTARTILGAEEVLARPDFARSLQLIFHAVFFFMDTPTTEIYTLSLHDALPI